MKRIKSALAKRLVPSWSGRWDFAIVGEYFSLRELVRLTRLVRSGRWKFDATPSVRKSGITAELQGQAGVNDGDLRSLPRLPTIHTLILADSDVTDAGLNHLTRLPALECLVLCNTTVTDAALEHLRQLSGLQTLDVEGTQISDESLRAAGLLEKKFSLRHVEREAEAERNAAADDAVAAWVELVAINRRLAAMRPEACLPDLAVSLNNLGWSRTSDWAAAALQESVDISRRLAKSDPEAYRPTLSNSLSNLSGTLEKLGRHEDALATLHESIDLSRQGPSLAPNADTALNLHRLGKLCSHVGRYEEAVQVTRESADVYRQCVAASPNASVLRSWFVDCLSDLSEWLNTLGHPEQAEVVKRECEEMRR